MILVIEFLPVSGMKIHSKGCIDVLSKLQAVNSGSDKEQPTVSLKVNNHSVDFIILENVYPKNTRCI